MSTMQTKALFYYSDFYVYPVVMVGLAVTAVRSAPEPMPLQWIVALLAGVAVWTLAEYLIHRILLHRVGYFHDMHEKHHAAPSDMISTPIWISFLALLGGVFLPSVLLLGVSLGCCFSFGLIFGYVAYSFLHHVLHHWRIEPGSLLYQIKRRHALHHHRDDEGNFGVTNLFWDRVFGTVLSHSARRS